jgi:two-component system, OmpR family, KDP operon response regulator KdpE
LRALLQHRGRLLSHHVLMQQVWGPTYTPDPPTLRTHIANLRRKIEPPNAACLIETDHGIGYRFTARTSDARPLRVAA